MRTHRFFLYPALAVSVLGFTACASSTTTVNSSRLPQTVAAGAQPPAKAIDGAPAVFPYVIGADLSFLRQAEQRGTHFKEAGIEKPGLQIFHDHGYGWIRLRLFHT